MQNPNYQLVLTKIAKLWRAGFSGFLLLNLALLQAVVLPVSANNAAPAFSSEIKSAGHSVQRDLPRVNLLIANEIANGNNDESSADATLSTATQPLFNKNTLTVFIRPAVLRGSSRYAYFLPEPRAAPQA